MSVSQYWFAFFSCVLAGAGCASESSSPLAGAAESGASLTSEESTDPAQREGGQSGTDSGGSFACSGDGRPVLQSIGLGEVPAGYGCAPYVVLNSLTGVHTLRCNIGGKLTVDSANGPTLTLSIDSNGAVAFLIDAVSSGEDGVPGKCTSLGIGASIGATIPEIGFSGSPDRIDVDRFCDGPHLSVEGHATFSGEEVDATLTVSFDRLTGRVNSSVLNAEGYWMQCNEVPPGCQ